MATTPVGQNSPRSPDRVAASLAGGFVVLLLATEVVLSLPDETASAASVGLLRGTSNLHHHPADPGIRGLRPAGRVRLAIASGRSGRVDRGDGHGGLQSPPRARHSRDCGGGRSSQSGGGQSMEPAGAPCGRRVVRRDLVFAAAVALRLGRSLPALGVLALLVAVGCFFRLGLEAAGVGRGPLDAIVPLSFLILIAVMAALSLLGVLRPGARHQPS